MSRLEKLLDDYNNSCKPNENTGKRGDLRIIIDASADLHTINVSINKNGALCNKMIPQTLIYDVIEAAKQIIFKGASL